MYGYVRPCKPELRIKEWERYQAAYCGLCHTLRKRYGLLARLLVNYDMTLPVLMLPGAVSVCRKRCPVHPFRRRCVCAAVGEERAADMTVILAYYKTDDEARDGRGLKKLAGKLGRFLLRRKFRRAKSAEPEFAALVADRMGVLTELERTLTADDGRAALDRTADCFGDITGGFASLAPGDERIWREIFYHVGRFVYLLDAADDYEKDCAAGAFNPLRLRYPALGAQLTDDVRNSLRETLELSLARAAAAFELLSPTAHTAICANILYLGLPAVMEQILSGRKGSRRERRGTI